MEPKAPRAGDVVRFTFEATSPEVPCCGLYGWLGDGYGFREGDVFFPGTSRPPMVHVFTEPGTYAVTVTASSYACDGSEEQQGSATLVWAVPTP